MCFVKKLVLPFFLSPYLFCFFFSLPFGSLKAQYYPVQGTLQVKRPYSLYLNDYTLPSREALVVSLTNRDIQHPTLQVRLRLRIKNSACLVQTRDEHYFSPFSLEVNFPVRLTSSDLQEYFHPDALGGYGHLSLEDTSFFGKSQDMREVCQRISLNTDRV